MKKTYIFAAVLGLVVVIAGIVLLKPSMKSDILLPEESPLPLVKEETLDPDAPNMSVDHTDLSLDYKYMGKEGIGFIKVPGNWVNYHVIGQNGEEASFSDVAGKSIVTLKKTIDDGQDLTLLAQENLTDLEGQEVEVVRVEIANTEGAFYLAQGPEDQSTAFWVFKLEGEVYKILLTGGSEVVKESAQEIEKSFLIHDPAPKIITEEIPVNIEEEEPIS